MRFALALLVLACALHAKLLLQYNIYQRTEHTDIMLNFDKPFDGNVAISKGEGYTSLILEGVMLRSPVQRTFSNTLLEGLNINGDATGTTIIVSSKEELFVSASKTSNGYGLRLRFSRAAAQELSTPTQEKPSPVEETPSLEQPPPAPLFAPSPAAGAFEPVPTPPAPAPQNPPLALKQESIDTQSYLVVLGVLAILALVLYLIKRKLSAGASSWLFDAGGKGGGKMQVLEQRPLDMRHKLVLFEAQGFRYLAILAPHGVQVVDRFPADGTQVDTEGFERILSHNQERLGSYLGIENKTFERYKQKASG